MLDGWYVGQQQVEAQPTSGPRTQPCSSHCSGSSPLRGQPLLCMVGIWPPIVARLGHTPAGLAPSHEPLISSASSASSPAHPWSTSAGAVACCCTAEGPHSPGCRVQIHPAAPQAAAGTVGPREWGTAASGSNGRDATQGWQSNGLGAAQGGSADSGRAPAPTCETACVES
jgi:hypothetical protein